MKDRPLAARQTLLIGNSELPDGQAGPLCSRDGALQTLEFHNFITSQTSLIQDKHLHFVETRRGPACRRVLRSLPASPWTYPSNSTSRCFCPRVQAGRRARVRADRTQSCVLAGASQVSPWEPVAQGGVNPGTAQPHRFQDTLRAEARGLNCRRI